jgi:Tol biopolymer transport system component
MTVFAPPRSPSPARTAPDNEPLDREEIEALVEALIEEARRETRRRHRRYWAIAALLVFVGVVVLILLQSGAASQPASPALSGRFGLAAGTTSSKLAFVRTIHSACCGRGPIALYVMNADGSGKRMLTRDVFTGAAWSPDGQKIAFTRDHHRKFVPGAYTPADSNIAIHVINADGSGERRLTLNAGNHFGAVWSPDGRRIAFGHGAGGHSEQIYIMNADGSEQRRLTRLTGYNSVLAWLPDGKIAFLSSHGPNDFEIYLMNADGSGLRNLTREWGLDGFPAWSPDGQKIAFTSKRDGDWEVYVMNADGTGQRNLTRNAALEWAPAWSPDGRKIALGRDRGGSNDEIYVINADGSGQRRLTESGQRPLWSPDGQKIAFRSKRNGNDDIYVMNPDGSAQRNLTRNPARVDDSLAWSPVQK